MGWVVDKRLERLRDTAIRELTTAGDWTARALSRAQALEGQTRATVGSGHAEGDRLVTDLAQAKSCCAQARTAIQSAIVEARQINILVWVD